MPTGLKLFPELDMDNVMLLLGRVAIHHAFAMEPQPVIRQHADMVAAAEAEGFGLARLLHPLPGVDPAYLWLFRTACAMGVAESPPCPGYGITLSPYNVDGSVSTRLDRIEAREFHALFTVVRPPRA